MSDTICKNENSSARTGPSTAQTLGGNKRLALACAICVVSMWAGAAPVALGDAAAPATAPAAVNATTGPAADAMAQNTAQNPAASINDSAVNVPVYTNVTPATPATAPAAAAAATPAPLPSVPSITAVAQAAPAAENPAAPATQSGAAPMPPISMQGPAENTPPPPQMTIDNPASRTRLNVMVNKSVVLTTKYPYTRVSVAQPDIADVNLLTPSRLNQHQASYDILLTGKKPGTTQVIVWDAEDRAQVIDVTVQIDVAGLQEQVHNLFPTLNLDVRSINGIVAIKGHVPSLAVADQVLQVARPFTPSVLDLMEISGGEQVILQVRFAEVSKTADSELGVNFGFSDGKSYFGNNTGNVSPFGIQTGTSGGGTSLTAATPSPAVSIFGQAEFGEEALDYFVDALRSNNLMRTLAEPNVMAISGQEASFLAGGQIPIPVAQPGGGGAISITYQEYGVKLKFVPVVLGDGRIRLKVSPEVSDLDYSNAVSANGFKIPALTQRSLSTTVELADGQTFAVGGLLDNEVAANSSITPVLGDLPVLGPLFRSVRYTRTETELVVLVTPHLVEPLNPVQVPNLPGEVWRTPSEGELFWNADLGGTAAADANHRPRMTDSSKKGMAKSAPMFHGQYGFVAVEPASDGVASIHD